MASKKCSACDAQLDDRGDGIELWGSWFCSRCFISHSAQTHKELRPEDIELIRRIGREMAGLLPPDLVEMMAIGFHQRSTNSKGVPPKEELDRFVGEIQRLTAFACARRVLNLLKTWQDMFNEFVESQEQEIRGLIRRMTE